jgi:bacterioferritin-associated ferredoxin
LDQSFLTTALASRYVRNAIDNHSHLEFNYSIQTDLGTCNAITDKQIRRAARNGVNSLYELRGTLGVSAGCGSCARTAQEILNEEIL